MTLDAGLVLVGLGVLVWGADLFVLGAARLAVTFEVSPVVIGAVVVGFGTGTPELLVSSSAAASGSLDMAAGNIVGSNLANLTLVLGVAGLFGQPDTVPRIIRREAPLSLATVALFALLLQNGLTSGEGILLLAAFLATVVLILRATEAPPTEAVLAVEASAVEELIEEVAEFVEEAGETGVSETAAVSVSRAVLRTAIGLIATLIGAQLLVRGARGIATEVGLSGGFVGLTLVAIGTSLPELVTAAQSARRNETALLAGNVLGSNVFNSTAVAGVAALIGPGALTDAGLTVVATTSMVCVAALAWLFLGQGGRLRRSEAAILLAIYPVTLALTG